MLNMHEVANYGPCYVLAINCPADGIDLPRKATLFDVADSATHETLDTFRTARQAKKFCHKYIADPTGALQQRRQLSADRITHIRALWAVSLLSNQLDIDEYEIVVTDQQSKEIERFQVSDVFISKNSDSIILYRVGQAPHYINGVKAVRVVGENTFIFETYQGIIYMVSGMNLF